MTENKNPKEKTFFQKYWFIILLVAAILILPVYTYIKHFHYKIGNTDLSYSPAHWGVLGDFLNPFIAIANLIVLVFISFEIKNIENKREKEKQLRDSTEKIEMLRFQTEREERFRALDQKREKEKDELEQKRLQQSLDIQVAITISQMRNERVIALTKVLDKITIDDVDAARRNVLPNGMEDRVNEIKKNIEHFNKNNHELFLNKNGEDKLKIIASTNMLNYDYVIEEINAIRELYSKQANIKGLTFNNKFKEEYEKTEREMKLRYGALKTAIENSIELKDSLVWALNKIILEDLKRG